MSTGARLRVARQARGFSQQQLAGMARVTRQAVSAVESGQSDPSLRVALALAQALGMSVDELFGAEGTVPAVSARPVGGSGGARGRGTPAPIRDLFVALAPPGPTGHPARLLPARGPLVSRPAPGT